MTREELNKLLVDYADAAYWWGEETGNYGGQDPVVHNEIEEKIWLAISHNKPSNPTR